MTDFWELQDRARHRSFLLIFLFACSSILTLLVLNIVVAGFSRWDLRAEGLHRWLWDSGCWARTTGAALLVITGGMIFKTYQLRSGGSAIADLLGGRRLSLATDSDAEVRLLNVVEEMAIASGLPMPSVYVVPFEFCINAFVAGHSGRDVCLGFTLGAVDKLTRDEMQALAATQFGHVFNGDMRLNMRLAVLLHGLMALATAGRLLVFGALGLRGLVSIGGRLLAPLWLGCGLAFWIVGLVGNLCGRLLQLAFCRQRAWLSDASAIQYTRNPDSVASLLKKAGAYNTWLRNPHGVEIDHFCFGDALGDERLGILRTHPRLLDRTRRIEPAFHGDFRKALDDLKFPEPQLPFNLVRGATRPEAVIHGDPIADAIKGSSPFAAMPAAGALLRIGTFDSHAIRRAAELRLRVADPLERARKDPLAAVALVYALLISSDESTREQQWSRLELKESQPLVTESRLQHDSVRNFDGEEKLTLIELLAAPLRALAADQIDQLVEGIDALARVDRQIDLFEFSLKKIVLHHLSTGRPESPREIERHLSETRLVRDSEIVISALAHVGHDDAGEIEAAFSNGRGELDVESLLVLQPLESCGLEEMNAALDRLCWLRPMDKKRFITACVATVSSDGQLREKEKMLFRATCAAIDIPCPPLI
ncbi:MAG: M48 family metalloprotease [Verrucomicrobiae bacterium]|nr:M48 family metalloprotease [Verrucomicrobiae bacterium]